MFSPHPLHLTVKSQIRDSGRFHTRTALANIRRISSARLWIRVGHASTAGTKLNLDGLKLNRDEFLPASSPSETFGLFRRQIEGKLASEPIAACLDLQEQVKERRSTELGLQNSAKNRNHFELVYEYPGTRTSIELNE